MDLKQPNPDRAVETAADLFREGRLEEAADLCVSLLNESQDDPVLHNLMGAILHRQGRATEAAFHWKKAIALAPGMAPARLNLARHLLGVGKPGKALPHLQKAADLIPGDPGIRRELASLLLDAGRHAEALDHLNHALELSPGEPRLQNAKAGCLASLGRVEEAAGQYVALLGAAPGYWQARYNYALLLAKIGRHQDVAEHCRLLAELVPEFGAGLELWAGSLLRLSRFGQAAQVLERCLKLAPGNASLLALYGLALMRLGHLEKAEQNFNQSLDIDPNNTAARQNLAALLSQSLRYDEALGHAQAGLELAPGSIDLALIASKCLVHTKQPEKAREFMDGFLAGKAGDQTAVNPDKLGDLLLELADLNDRLGDAGEAFHHTMAGNRQKAKLIRSWLPGAELFKRQIDELAELYGSGTLEITVPCADEPAPPPVFLVGFPRSGTTLFKQILDAHTRITALDEKPGFQYVREAMARELKGGFPGGLAGMSREERKRYARMYQDDVTRRSQAGPGVMILDKSPLDMVFAGPINLLFPNAKFFLMARHPLDACLSCLMRNFTLQERTVDFTALETTVALYEKAFDIWRLYTEKAGLDHHLIRYEDLLADMPGRTGEALRYLGLNWEESIMDYRGNVKSDGQAVSLSHHQVAEPLYQRAKFRWQRYAEHLEPVFGRLRPYCLWLGYGDPDQA